MTTWMHPLAEPLDHAGSSDHSIVLVHGFLGSVAHMRPLADRFIAAGHSVVVPSLEGHGTSVEDLARATRLSWQTQLDTAIRHAEDLARNVHLVGYDLGGLLCMFAADSTIATLSLINPLVVFRDKGLYLATALSSLSKYQEWPDQPPPVASKRKYDVAYATYPTKVVKQMFEARAAALTAAQWIERPTLIVQSSNDRIVNPNGADGLRDRLVRATVEVHWLEHSPHLALLGGEFDEVYDAIGAHMANA